MNQNKFSGMHVLDERQLETVSGGSAYEDGITFGVILGGMYWGARSYMSETVYPYWLG
jgi:hypothetical protein